MRHTRLLRNLQWCLHYVPLYLCLVFAIEGHHIKEHRIDHNSDGPHVNSWIGLRITARKHFRSHVTKGASIVLLSVTSMIVASYAKIYYFDLSLCLCRK